MKKTDGPLTGKKVVVTAGPTREHIDPVRFISNPSSGKMGFAMAEAARDLGGDVTLVHGPVALTPPKNISIQKFESAADLFEVMKNHANADIIIMAAAVSDFTPKEKTDQKIKKQDAAKNIPLKATTDILAWLGERKQNGQILIGFAMETDDLINNARQKLGKKNLDWIVANSLNHAESGFESDTNTVHLLSDSHNEKISGSKKEVAQKVLDQIFGS